MIVNFRTTKAFLTRFMVLASIIGNIYAIITLNATFTRFLILASILANVYAIIALNATEQSLAGCESYIEQIQDKQAQYVALFGEAE